VIRIIGIGSPFGDDAAGLEALRMLAQAPPPNCELIAADRPGAALIEMFDNADAVILVDAVFSGSSPGKIHELTFDALDNSDLGFVSSHELDVAAAVRLARKLGRSASRGRVIGLEVAPPRPDRMFGLSAEIRDALALLVERVRVCAAQLNAACPAARSS
jgi:hydrogenase maturation protease